MNSDANKEGFLEKMNQTFLSGYTMAGLVLGRKVGLFQEFGAEQVTSMELADRANCKERYVREWLHHMVMCDIVDVDESGKLFSIPAHKRDVLIDPTQLILAAGNMIPYLLVPHEDILACFPKDGPMGVPFEKVRPLLKEFTQFSKNSYLAAVDFLTSRVPGLLEQLESGIRVCEIGTGSGNLLVHLAKRFPKTTFMGIDLNGSMLSQAREAVKRNDLPNAQLQLLDATKLPEQWNDSFDFMLMRDVLHDIAQPSEALQAIHRCLKTGGRLSVFEVNISGNPHAAKANATEKLVGQMFYIVSTYHCLAASMNVPGSVGLGACSGKENIVRLAEGAGFIMNGLPEVTDPMTFHILCNKV